MLKKVLSIVLTLAILSCLFVTAVSADSQNAPPERVGAVYEIVYEHPDHPTRGLSGEAAQKEAITANYYLTNDIRALTYMEFYRSEPNKSLVGLPDGAVDKVKAIPYVESVTPYDPFKKSDASPEDKPTADLKDYIALHEGEPMNLRVTFCYDGDTVFVGLSKSQAENYAALKKQKIKALCTALNQKGFDKLAETVDASLIEVYNYTEPHTVTITASAADVTTIAGMDFVDRLQLQREGETPTEPTDPPAERETGFHMYYIHVYDDGVSEAYSDADATIEGSTEITLTAIPAEGYRFKGWTIYGKYYFRSGSLSDPKLVIMPCSDIDATAQFEAIESLSDKFEAWMASQYIVKAASDDAPIHYGEEQDYRAYKELAVTDDWALIQAHVVGLEEPWEMVFSFVFGKRVLSWWKPGAGTYPYGLFVYDAAQDKFFAIDKVKPEDYPGLAKTVSDLKLGRALGDADGDNELSILDATAIQRDLADLEKIPQDDQYLLSLRQSRAYADADCDNDITIVDATRIQRILAGMERDPSDIKPEDPTGPTSPAYQEPTEMNDGPNYHPEPTEAKGEDVPTIVRPTDMYDIPDDPTEPPTGAELVVVASSPNYPQNYNGFAYCRMYNKDTGEVLGDPDILDASHLATFTHENGMYTLSYRPSEHGVEVPDGYYTCSFLNEKKELITVRYYTVVNKPAA